VTFDLLTVSAVAGAIAYGAAQGVFRAITEHRKGAAQLGANLGPRVEDLQGRVSYVEGLLGIKKPREDEEHITPTQRPPMR